MTEGPGNVAWKKEGLRARMEAARAELLPLERLALSERIEHRLFELPETAAARTVLIYSAFGTEVPTFRMIKRLQAERFQVLLPGMRQGEMAARPFPPGSWLVETDYGPKEPHNPFEVDPVEIDLVVAPGLAFDAEGNRLGHGRGHYDRYFTRMGPRATRVGIGFDVQLVERVPHTPGDERLDVIVTDARTVRAGTA